jgi:DNA-binding response OmpR family regulator
VDRPNLRGCKVLVVEDEMMIAMLIEDMLEELGCELVGPASKVERALELIASETIEIALLDVNLDGHATDAVACELRRKGVPFVFATGYGATGVPKQYNDRAVLQKPFQKTELAAALSAAIDSQSDASHKQRRAL